MNVRLGFGVITTKTCRRLLRAVMLLVPLVFTACTYGDLSQASAGQKASGVGGSPSQHPEKPRGTSGGQAIVAGASGAGGGSNPSAEYPPDGCGPMPAYRPVASHEFAVGALDYDSGTISVGVRPATSLAVKGRVYYPAQTAGNGVRPAAGRFPVIVMLHGNHSRYRDENGKTISCSETFAGGRHLTLEEVQETHPGASVIPSHLGYAYLGESLARAGYVFVSIDGNDANCVNVGGGGFNAERAELMRAHVDLLTNAQQDQELAPLGGSLDLDQLVLAGHSRGGEAAIELARSEPINGATLRGTIAVAPTDLLFDATGFSLPASLLVVLPAADGDVTFNSGMRYYDVIKSDGRHAGWFKAQQYVHGANHNFFNSEWSESYVSCGMTSSDGDNGAGNGENRLTRAEQERYLVAIIQAYLAATLDRDEQARTLLAGNARLADLETLAISASFADGSTMLPLVSEPEYSGFDEFEKYFFLRGDGTYNDTFFHYTSGYVGVWSSRPASFDVLVREPPESFEFVSLRVAQVVDDLNVHGRQTTVDVELEDASGHKVRAASDFAKQKIPSWYERPLWRVSTAECKGIAVTKTVLSTVRIPKTCFKGDPRFSYRELSAIRVYPNGESGVLAFTDFQLPEATSR